MGIFDDAIAEIEEKAERTLEIVDMLLGAYIEIIQHAWDIALQTANPGQAEVIVTQIIDELIFLMDGLAEAWPDIEVGEYVDTMYSNGNAEMRERAFSDTIEGPTDRMQEIVDTAQAMDALFSSLMDRLLDLLSRN